MKVLEINILTLAFKFAPLKINIIRPEGFFRRHQHLGMIRIRRHAPLTPATKIKIADFALLARVELVGILRCKNAHVGIDWQPAIGSETNFRPIMDVLRAGKSIPARLPPRREKYPSPTASARECHS